jgi:hypothetical protein
MGRSEQAAEVLENQIVDRATTAKIPVDRSRPVFGHEQPGRRAFNRSVLLETPSRADREIPPLGCAQETLMSGVRHRCGTLSLFAGASK